MRIHCITSLASAFVCWRVRNTCTELRSERSNSSSTVYCRLDARISPNDVAKPTVGEHGHLVYLIHGIQVRSSDLGIGQPRVREEIFPAQDVVHSHVEFQMLSEHPEVFDQLNIQPGEVGSAPGIHPRYV